MSDEKTGSATPLVHGVACEPETPEHAFARGVAFERARCVAVIEKSITGWLTPEACEALRDIAKELVNP